MESTCQFQYRILCDTSRDRDREGFVGPVSSFQLYRADFINDNGKWIEGQKHLLNSDGFDRNGSRWESRARYPYFYHCYNRVDMKSTYDARGYRVDTLSFTWTHNDEPNGREINTFDDKDRTIESLRVGKDGNVPYRMLYKRNETGNPVEIEYYSLGNLTQKRTYTYEYDSRGNWVKQVETKWAYESGKAVSEPVMVYYRTVWYYSAGP